MNVNLVRRVADIYIPPVEVIDDRSYMDSMMAAHIEQKNFFNALVTDEVCHEDVLEFVEAYIGTREMDIYIDRTEQQLTQLIGCDS